MIGKIVTLYIDDTSIRLLVTKGKRIQKWADLPLETGLIKGARILNAVEVAAQIKQLLKTQKVKTKNVIVGLSGLHCLSRPTTLPQLPKAMLAEAVIREAKRVLPVPLEQLYISWQTIPAPEGKTQALLVATPRQATDVLLQTLRQAGLQPRLMDIKPLALVRVLKETTAVIVDTQSTEFDIVIVVDGIPQPIRTVSFPSEELSWQEKLPIIRDDLDRTIKFYNSNNADKSLDSGTPVFVSGELAREPELCLSLSDELGYPVMPLSSPLECPEHLDPTRYMTNIGLALKKLSLGKKVGPSVTNLDLLPAAYRPRPVSWAKIIALPSATVVVGILVSLVMLTQVASANIFSMRGQLQVTNQTLKQKQLQKQELIKNIAELETKLVESEAARDTFVQAIGSLDRQGDKINGDLEAATDALSSTMSLTDINRVSGVLTVSGMAAKQIEVLSYAGRLGASGRFSEIIVSSMRKTEDGSVDFVLLLKTRG